MQRRKGNVRRNRKEITVTPDVPLQRIPPGLCEPGGETIEIVLNIEDALLAALRTREYVFVRVSGAAHKTPESGYECGHEEFYQ